MLSVLAASGCATPAVLDRWRAHDAVRRVRFRLHDALRDDPTLSWRVESHGLSDRRGTIALPGVGKGCDRLNLASGDGEKTEEPASRRLVIDLEQIPNPPKPVVDPSPPPDCAIVVDLLVGLGRGDPRFELRRRGTTIVQLETPSPRRGRWLVLLPVAGLADAPLVVVGVAALPIVLVPWLLGNMDDFSWVPGCDIDWHRRASDEKRSEKER